MRSWLPSVLILSFFTLVALAFQIPLLLKPTPLVFLGTDSGNIASFSAAWQYPERFRLDPILSTRQHYSFYITILIPFTIAINGIVGDVGTALALAQFPIVLFQLVGFWRLGLFLYGRHLPAISLALLSLPPLYFFAGGELWGMYYEPLPRMMLNAAFPYLILLCLRYGSSRYGPIWIMAVCGLTIYLHPVSTPTVALGLWLGCWALRSHSERAMQKAGIMLLAGLAFIVVAVPFAAIFVATSPGFQASRARAFWEVVVVRYGPLYSDAWLALKTFALGPLPHGTNAWQWAVWAAGLVGFALVGYLRPNQRRAATFFGLLFLGILLGSFGVSWFDQTITRHFDRAPFQMDLIRNLRLTPLLLLIGAVWTLSLAETILREYLKRWASVAFTVLYVAFVVIWWNKQQPSLPVLLARALIEGKTPVSAADREQAAALALLRDAPADSLVLTLGNQSLSLAVRHGSLQPLALISKDANVLLFTGHDIQPLLDQEKRLERLRNAKTEGEAGAILRDLMTTWNPKYVLIDRQDIPAAVVAAAMSFGALILDGAHVALLRVGSPAP